MHHLEALIVKWSNPLQSSRWLEKRKTSGIAVIKRVFNFSWSQLLFDPSLSIALRVVRKLWLSLRHSNLWTSHCLVKFLNYTTIPKASPHQRETQIPLRIQATLFICSFICVKAVQRKALSFFFIYIFTLPFRDKGLLTPLYLFESSPSLSRTKQISFFSPRRATESDLPAEWRAV